MAPANCNPAGDIMPPGPNWIALSGTLRFIMRYAVCGSRGTFWAYGPMAGTGVPYGPCNPGTVAGPRVGP